jgi:hypothetical protein
VQAVASQTANVQQWLGASGTVEGYVLILADANRGNMIKTKLAVDGLTLLDGNENVYSAGGITAGAAMRIWFSGNGDTLNITGQSYSQIATFSNGAPSFRDGVSFGATGTGSITADISLVRDAANILNQRRTTNAQTWRLSNTWQSATSYEWLSIGWSGNVCTITTEKGSAGGTLRGLKIGDASTALLGFYGATPVDRPDTVADPTGGSTIDSEARTAINAIIDRLQELGLIA